MLEGEFDDAGQLVGVEHPARRVLGVAQQEKADRGVALEERLQGVQVVVPTRVVVDEVPPGHLPSRGRAEVLERVVDGVREHDFLVGTCERLNTRPDPLDDVGGRAHQSRFR